MIALYHKLLRWKYVILTYKDYYKFLNRAVDVANTLNMVSLGQREPLSPDECRDLARKLTVPT